MLRRPDGAKWTYDDIVKQRDDAHVLLRSIREAYIHCVGNVGEEYAAARLKLFEQIAKIPESLP